MEITLNSVISQPSAFRHIVRLSFSDLLPVDGYLTAFLIELWGLKKTLNLTEVRASELTFIEYHLRDGTCTQYHSHNTLVMQLSFSYLTGINLQLRELLSQQEMLELWLSSSALWPFQSCPFHQPTFRCWLLFSGHHQEPSVEARIAYWVVIKSLSNGKEGILASETCLHMVNLVKKTWSWLSWKSSSWPAVPAMDDSISAWPFRATLRLWGVTFTSILQQIWHLPFTEKILSTLQTSFLCQNMGEKRQPKAKSWLSSFSVLSGPF